MLSTLQNSEKTGSIVTITTPNGTYQGVVTHLRPESGNGSTGRWLVTLDSYTREIYVRTN